MTYLANAISFIRRVLMIDYVNWYGVEINCTDLWIRRVDIHYEVLGKFVWFGL